MNHKVYKFSMKSLLYLMKLYEAYSNNCIDGYELDELCNIYENRNVA